MYTDVSGQCPCPCNYASDPSCSCRDLASSLTVSLSKGPLWASYPLTYLQSFNYKPYEAIVRPGAGNCKADAFDEAPTCSWYYVMGQKVDDSQGFVCECDAGQIWDTTFSTNTERTRANLDCDFFSDPLDILIGRKPCSAHCLMMDEHWYGGYGLGEASLQFEITAALTYAGGSSSSSSSGEALKLSPSMPWALSAGRTLGAKLLGDLAGYTQLPVLSERVLMIPHPRNGQSINDMFNNRTEWMLVDRSKISFTGNECDKVGTSFTAFRYQTGACVRAPQVCLSNQLKDILEADFARIRSGKAPLYLVSQYSYGLNSSMRAFAGGPLLFALPVTGIRSSLVQLEATADEMRFIVNTSPGKILGARVCQFAEVSCGGFEASATRGFLHAFIANTGTLPAAYTLTVSNCSVNIRPVDAQRVALAPGQNGTISPFVIYVEDDKAVAARFCWLAMLDARGGVSDRVHVEFYTNATAYEEWPSGGLLGNGTGPGTQTTKDCSNICNNRFDVFCAAKNGCWGNVGRFFGLSLGLTAAAALLFFAYKFGWLASVLPLLGSCCGGGSSSSSSSNDKRSRDSRHRSKYGYEDEDEYASHNHAGKHKGRQKDSAGPAARYSSSGGMHGGQQYLPDMAELQAERQRQRHSSAGRQRGSSRSGRASSRAEAYPDEQQQQQDEYFEEDAGYTRGSSFYGSAKTADGNDGYNKYGSSSSGGGSPGRWIKAGPWDDSAAGAAGGGRLPRAGRASAVATAAEGGGRRRSSSAGGRPRVPPAAAAAAAAGGYFLDEDGYELEGQGLGGGAGYSDEDEGGGQQWGRPSLHHQRRAAALQQQQQLPARAYSSSPGGILPPPGARSTMRQSRSATQLSELVEVSRIQAACDRSLPQHADQKAFCSSCMCASSVALGASVDRSGKVIAGTNYSTIIASIPSNPLLAANSGLSNCGPLTSQVLQESGALDAATNEALTACQKLDPLFLLKVYEGCNFTVPADPALADKSPLAAILRSGLVPAGAVKAGQDAAAGVNKAVDGAKKAVQTVGDGSKGAAQKVADGGKSAVQAVQGAWGDMRRVFSVGG
ncbi:hypothetical protein OEZ85_013396 [Tetradesmus obliquus]|uniref:Generative cell specific-1/HAP2 domain-containing protein n=1 Tax=Tetradesmus obliquus TaxID=3088 RepID=A0ABY8U8K9_TETOB|nr:hypothetical protein OEZ85_013396 [Tetradesmus obliquus]